MGRTREKAEINIRLMTWDMWVQIPTNIENYCLHRCGCGRWKNFVVVWRDVEREIMLNIFSFLSLHFDISLVCITKIVKITVQESLPIMEHDKLLSLHTFLFPEWVIHY